VLVSESIRAASVLCGGALGALVLADVPWLQGDPLAESKGLALGVCLVTTISSVGTGVWLLTAAGLRLRPMIESLLVGPIACTLAGYGSWSIANSLVLSFDSLSSRRGAALVAIIELLIYSLILLGALQLLPPLRAAYINVAEPGLGGLKRFAQRLHLPVGD
jgi:hypothetical protein